MQAANPADLGFKRRADAEGRKLDYDADDILICPEAAVEIEDGANKLQTLLDANVDRNFDILEIYVLRNTLSIPQDLVSWIELSHYQVSAATICFDGILRTLIFCWYAGHLCP